MQPYKCSEVALGIELITEAEKILATWRASYRDL